MAEPQEEARRLEARRVIMVVARAIDRRLSAEVREAAAHDRLQVTLTHGPRHHQVELRIADVLAASNDTMARNALRLRLKRAADTMLFRPMPDHRISVKPIAPPGGQAPPKGRGRR